MKSANLALVCTAILLIFSSFGAVAQEVKDSSRVEYVNRANKANIKCMTPPSGFDTLAGLNGYYHKTIGASIVLSHVEGKTVADAEAAFNDKHIEAINSTLVSKTRMTLDDGNEMLIFNLTYKFMDETWGRYQAFVGDETSTLWVVISYPYKYSQDVEGILLKSLKTLKFADR